MQLTKLLEQHFGYTFKNTELLEQSLTHRSAARRHYERLEFLGDAVLGMVISNELYRRFPEADEGDLTRLRSQIVKGETLARLSKNLGLGEHIIFGPGEMKSGSRRRASILADVLESILGAIFIDSDMVTVQGIILRLFDEPLAASHPEKIIKDPKTRLQEYLQARTMDLPEYSVEQITGPAHKQYFKVRCRIDSLNLEAEGEGSSRKHAEQDAAEKIYQKVQHV
ncbi:MAG: ribonuclease III [Gammaproteobacteria bacterium]